MAESNGLCPKTQQPVRKRLTLAEYLEILAKLGIGLSTVCYVIGFLVVHIHLSKAGYFGVGLSQFQYVAAGLLALAPLVAGWIAFFVLFPKILMQKPEALNRYQWIGIVGFFVSVAALAAVGTRIALLPLVARAGLLGLLGFLIPVMVYWSIDQIRWLASEASRNAPAALDRIYEDAIKGSVIMPVMTAGYILLYISTLSGALYGEVPAEFGGGRPRIVRLVVNRDHVDALSAAGIAIPAGTLTSAPLKLLVATDREYVLLPNPSSKPVIVRAEVVQAMLGEP